MAAKTHFCAFVASNTRRPRTTRSGTTSFNRLSRYKKVDAGGRAFNNIGTSAGGTAGQDRIPEAIQVQHRVRERVASGIHHEKIVEPMAARCLPIYLGNPLVEREFNPKSFSITAIFVTQRR